MNKQTFLNIVKDPTSIGGQDIAGLEEVVASFPFCQAAHLLIAKGSRDYGSMHAEQKLKKAAAYCLNRKKLKEIIRREKKQVKISPVNPVTATEEALPTVDKILAEQHEKTSSKRKYEDIEANLKLIELFKSEAQKKSAETETLNIEQEIPAKEILENATLQRENQKEAEVAAEEFSKGYIYSSRLEDVFLQELEIDSVHHKSEADLLLNYLEFIHENKLGKMRDKKKQKEIIEKFIHADPVIPALKPDALKEEQEDLASASGRISKNPVSETFARILAVQGKKDKAIEIYEQLILKFPEKKAYFTAEIDKLKK